MVCKCKHGRIWHLKSGVCGYDGSVIGEQDYCDARCKKFPSQKPSGESMEKAIGVVAYGVRFSKQDSSPDGMELEERIAFALDAQRERVVEECAKVAGNYDHEQRRNEFSIQENIVDAIRSLGNREEGK